MAIIIGGLILLVIKLGREYVGPCLIKYIQKSTANNIPKVQSIREHIPQGCYNKTISKEEIKIMMNHYIEEQNKKLKEMKQEINELRERERLQEISKIKKEKKKKEKKKRRKG
jgi:hypothetical protein